MTMNAFMAVSPLDFLKVLVSRLCHYEALLSTRGCVCDCIMPTNLAVDVQQNNTVTE